MATCPACQRDVPEERKDCPYCGVIFAKWKDHKERAAAVALESNTAHEQVEEDQPDFYPLPPLSPNEREVLIKIESSDESERLHARSTVLNEAGIYTEVRKSIMGFGVYNVYVPLKHLLPVMVIEKLRDEHMSLARLASQPVSFRQKLLVDAMVATAKAYWAFKCSLFPQQTLAWYQAYAKLTDQQLQSALTTAPQAFRRSTRNWIIGSACIGAFCISVGLANRRGDLGWLFYLGVGLMIYGLKRSVDLVRSEKEWMPSTKASLSPNRIVQLFPYTILLLVVVWIGLIVSYETSINCGDHPDRSSSNLEGEGKVYFIPLGDFPSESVALLVAYYKQKFDLRIETLPGLSLEDNVRDSSRNQLVAENVIAMMKNLNSALALDHEAILIGITNEDMYIQKNAWRFAFAWRERDRLAVVSTAHMVPFFRRHHFPHALLFGLDDKLLHCRLKKMVSKYIGLMHYGLSQSNDPKSVLYGPILSLGDLDNMGEEI